MFCQPSDPKTLFDHFWKDWTDDFVCKGQSMNKTFTQEQLKTMVRLDLQVCLQSYEKDLEDFGLDPMSDAEKQTVAGLVNIESVLIREEMEYDITELQTNVDSVIGTFTEDQKKIFDTVMKAVREEEEEDLFFYIRSSYKLITADTGDNQYIGY